MYGQTGRLFIIKIMSSAQPDVSGQIDTNMLIMALPVMEFQVQGYKFRKIFA